MEYKNTRQIYKEKMSEAHPPEEILAAFVVQKNRARDFNIL